MINQFHYSKNIKTGIIILLFIFLNNFAVAQNNEKTVLSNINLYADAGLHFAGQISINLEVKIHSLKTLTFYGRGGYGEAAVMFGDSGRGWIGALTMLTGKKNNHFEMNGGAFFGKDTSSQESFVYPLLDLGYRYQKPEGGFIFRAKMGILGGGLGLGYAF
jgi:hypothetical protein